MQSLRYSANIRITADPHYMRYGLFGQVLLYVFRILPYLESRGIFPQWAVGAELYGADPDRIVIPGLFDLAYDPPKTIEKEVSLENLYKWRQSYLGSDFEALSKLWKRYFTVPARIEAAADETGPLGDTLGVHYRGNEKLTSTWDSNFISPDDFLEAVADFLARRPQIRSVLIATDDAGFKERAAARLDRPVIARGPGRFMFEEKSSAERTAEADKALLDCLLLSRCQAVMSTSSALSAFAKVLRPELEIYRCAASKMFEDAPYFPVAYIPIYQPEDPAAAAVVDRAMLGDWTQAPQFAKYSATFAHRPRSLAAHLAFRIRGRLGMLPVQVWTRAQRAQA
jgi:hypothetical protein